MQFQFQAIETQCVISSGKKTAKKVPISTVTKPTIATSAKATHSTVISKPSLQVKSMLPPLPKSRPPITTQVSHVPKLSLTSTLRSVPATVAKPSDKPTTLTKPVARQPSPSVKKPAPSLLVPSKCKVRGTLTVE